MFGIPSIGGPSAANANASSQLTNEQKQDKSGLFQLGNITVATGKSSIAQSASAADGLGSGSNSGLAIAAIVAAGGAFAWLLLRQRKG